ncbi:MAG: hypothetical protein WBP12_00575 [Candidatus Saccharimonas sp.]
MTARSHEARLDNSETPTLYTLAEKLCDTPGGFDNYNYAKCVWLGNPDRTRRLAGEHPWPSRVRGETKYIYSVPVLAGVDAARETMLFVGKDDWKPVDDPNAWLVAERRLIGGEEIEHQVLRASVDTAHDLRLVIAPASFDNFPPQMRWAITHRPMYDQTVLSGRLDKEYNLQLATWCEGLDGSRAEYEDIEALESMIVVVQRLRAERAEWQERRMYDQRALVGRQGVWLDELVA